MVVPTEPVKQKTYECGDRITEGPSPPSQSGSPTYPSVPISSRNINSLLTCRGVQPQSISRPSDGLILSLEETGSAAHLEGHHTSIPVARCFLGDDGEWADEGSDGPEHKSP
ncbi:unnamed protein product [Lota lota]